MSYHQHDDECIFSIFACIKGYHAYKLKPGIGDTLKVKHDSNNKFDRNALGVYKNHQLHGHVPALPVPLNMCLKNIMEEYATAVTW